MRTLFKTQKIGVLILFMGTLLLSCKKDLQVSQNNEKKLFKKIKKSNTSSIERISSLTSEDDSTWIADIPIPSVSSYSDLFRDEGSTLQQVMLNGSETEATLYIRNLASQVAGYLYHVKGIDARNDFVNDPQGLIVVGLYFAAYEWQNNSTFINNNKSLKSKKKPDVIANSSDPMGCFLTAIGSVIGITDARNIWRSIVAGASEQTAIAAVKVIAKRSAVVISAVFAIYEAGDCLGWW